MPIENTSKEFSGCARINKRSVVAIECNVVALGGRCELLSRNAVGANADTRMKRRFCSGAFLGEKPSIEAEIVADKY
jgi:hypothetical protein